MHDNFFNIVKKCLVSVCQRFSVLSNKSKDLFNKVLSKIGKSIAWVIRNLIFIIYLKNWKILKPNLWLILLICIYGRRNILCVAKSIWLIWSKNSIGHKELKKTSSFLEIKTLDFFSLRLLFASGKTIYGKFSMRMAFGRTTSFMFCRSFTENSTKDLKRITICILSSYHFI